MGSHSGDKIDLAKVEETIISEPNVEIKIKTLDNQTYTLSVDKCVPVPTLKDQIATVTGILSERQRLICRGRVLKDDQLLSAYHVEDGHTLHLVVRDPVPPSQSTNDPRAPDYPPSAGNAQGAPGGPRVVVGTFNISGQGLGDLPDFSQILSSLYGSLGTPYDRNGNPSDNASELPNHTIHSTTSSGFGFEPQQPPSGAPQQLLHPPVIPDSLTTLSQYLNQVAVEFAIANGEEEIPPLQGAPRLGSDVPMPEISRVSLGRGLPTPETLADVLQSTRQLLINQTAGSLNRLATQLQNQANVWDASARMNIQSNAMRSGIFLRNLGALLLELGRTTMLLRMGETPTDAIVNAGSAVFVNESGPNPIMVQPFPTGTLHSGIGLGPSIVPSNVDIRIQTGVQQSGEPIGQATTETPPIASHRQAGVHIRPIRAVFGAFPVRPSLSTDSSRSAPGTGMAFPVMARVQRTSNNATDIRGSAASGHVGGQPGEGIRTAAAQYSGNSNYEAVNTSFDEYVRSVLNMVDENPPPHTAPAATNVQQSFSARASSSSPQTAPAPSDDGIFLSNLLQQIMPYISQYSASGSAGPSSAGDDNRQGNIAHGTSNARSPSNSQTDEYPSPDSKRQRME